MHLNKKSIKICSYKSEMEDYDGTIAGSSLLSVGQ